MRQAILFSIAISQIGFVTAYIIFVSSNMNSLVLSLSKCKTQLSSATLIFIQVILLLPLSLVRNLAKLSFTALIADGFILFGLLYIWGSEIGILVKSGPADISLWLNPKDFALLVGTAVFSFEGIGLIIPITDAMREPHKFPKVLSGVMIALIGMCCFNSLDESRSIIYINSVIRIRRGFIISGFWLQHPTNRDHQSPSRITSHSDCPASLLSGNSSIYPNSAVSCAPHNGNCYLRLQPERQSQ
jgi:hypothetical protein